jgi:glutaredoxin
MKKLIILGILVFCGYKGYQHISAANDKGPVAADGTPIAQLFIGAGCGQPCDEVEQILKSRNINHELIDISTPEGEKYGINQYPLTRVGKKKVLGNDRNQLVAVLAESYGESALTPGERIAMQGHFDEKGKPVVVLYGTTWCQYCKHEREYFAEHNIPFYDVDVEASPSAKMAYDTLQGVGYPLVYVGYRRFVGYKEKEILDAVAELIRG